MTPPSRPWDVECPACGARLVHRDGAPPADVECLGCGFTVGFEPRSGQALFVVPLQDRSEGLTTELIFLDGNAPIELGSALREWLRQRGIRRFVLDLGEVAYISSAMLAAMIQMKKHVPREGVFFLRRVAPDIAEVLRITRLDEFFSIIAEA